jgi:hypothetical protein
MLMRMLGNAIGCAAFGGVLNVLMLRHLHEAGWSDLLSFDDAQRLLGGESLSAAESQVLQGGLATGLCWVFWGVFAASLIAFVLSWRVRELSAKQPIENS